MRSCAESLFEIAGKRLQSFSRLRQALCRRILWLLVLSAVCPSLIAAQSWTWSTELIDALGTDSSIAVDPEGNLHVSYYYPPEGQLKYAFRGPKGDRWFRMSLDKGLGEFFTRIAVDAKGNPFICYSPQILKVAHFDGRRWSVQQVDPGGGLVSYTCSVAVGSDGAPRLSWYVESGVFLRFAILKDGVWVAQTADREFMPGKWNSLVLDSKDLPHLSYGTIFKWQLRYSYFDGKNWIHTVVDAQDKNPASEQRGMGNSLALDSQGNPMIAYYDVSSLKFARLKNGKWNIETLERFPTSGGMAGWKSYRSSLSLDREGNPHVVFITPMGLEHVWWDGNGWRTQLILALSGNANLDSSLAIGPDNTLYISYTDPADHSLKLAIGRPKASVQPTSAVRTDKEQPKN